MRERQLLSVHARCVLFCVNSARACSVSDTREPPDQANTWSMSNYPSWQVTLAIIHLYWIYILEYSCTDQQDICLFYFRASSVPWLHTNCTVGTRARHKSTNHAGERTSDTCSLIAWTIDLLNNILWEGRLLQRPKQLKIINQSYQNDALHRVLLCRLHVLFSINEAVTSSLHSNYSFFAEIIT